MKKFETFQKESQKSFEDRLENLRQITKELPDMLARYKSMIAEAGMSDSESDSESDEE